MDSDVSLGQAWSELNDQRYRDEAGATTVAALIHELRDRGIAALNERKARTRLSELGDAQLVEVGVRLRKFRPEIARAWSADEVTSLMLLHERLL